MQTSVYSLLSLTRAVLPILKDKGSILTLSYLGGLNMCLIIMLWV